MDYNTYLDKILTKEEKELLYKEYEKKAVTAVRINLLKYNNESFKKDFNILDKHDHLNEAYFFDKETNKLGKDPLHSAGAYYIQDASAMMVAHLIGIKKGDKVLDLCAAPGGKSSQVASYLQGTGILVSNDVSAKRVKDLSENIERMGIGNAVVMNETVDKISSNFRGFFDKVILDAPCSGQGMFRKNSLTYDDWTYEKTLNLAEIQKDLIVKAYNCLKKDGVMVYSTCTFAIEENENVIDYLLNNTNASIIKIEMKKDFNKPLGNNEGPIRLYPFNFKGEGHFICLIRCNDDHECNTRLGNKTAHSKEISVYREFEKQYMNVQLNGEFIKMGDELHLLPDNCFNLNGYKVLRNGIHLGTIKEKRFEPTHALALYLKKENVKQVIGFDHNDLQVINYLKGMTLNTVNNKGYVLVCVNGVSLGWCKDDGRLLKNLYPKGLRIQG
jgi:NOL1/NOP2/sun family putative RNA methylase